MSQNHFKLNEESDACLSNAHSHSQVQLSSAQSVIQRSICRCHRPPSAISPTHTNECTAQACCLRLILIKLSVGCAIPSSSTIYSLNRTHTQGKQRCVCVHYIQILNTIHHHHHLCLSGAGYCSEAYVVSFTCVYKGDKSLGLEFSSILTRLKAGLRLNPDKFCGIF